MCKFGQGYEHAVEEHNKVYFHFVLKFISMVQVFWSVFRVPSYFWFIYVNSIPYFLFWGTFFVIILIYSLSTIFWRDLYTCMLIIIILTLILYIQGLSFGYEAPGCTFKIFLIHENDNDLLSHPQKVCIWYYHRSHYIPC